MPATLAAMAPVGFAAGFDVAEVTGAPDEPAELDEPRVEVLDLETDDWGVVEDVSAPVVEPLVVAELVEFLAVAMIPSKPLVSVSVSDGESVAEVKEAESVCVESSPGQIPLK